jgi:hypothetical protein
MSEIIIVDDTNPNIQYSGPVVNVNAASFSYSFSGMSRWLVCFKALSLVFGCFSGSQVIVLGESIMTNASGTKYPTWECFIDNINIGRNVSAGKCTENSWVFCQSDLQDGLYVFSTNVTFLHQQTFSSWFDQIRYLPSSNVPLDNSTVRVDSSDPAVQYSSGWTELDDIANLTQNAGSTVTYEFFGP